MSLNTRRDTSAFWVGNVAAYLEEGEGEGWGGGGWKVRGEREGKEGEGEKEGR